MGGRKWSKWEREGARGCPRVRRDERGKKKG